MKQSTEKKNYNLLISSACKYPTSKISKTIQLSGMMHGNYFEILFASSFAKRLVHIFINSFFFVIIAFSIFSNL